jgi:hypothetical protein
MTDQEILDRICGLFGVATSTSVSKLVSTSATFITKGVVAGDLVINRTDVTSTIVLAIDSEISLSLRDDIFTTGEEYLIAGHLEKRYRFSKQDNLLDKPPLKEELEEQVYSSLGEINAHPPVTSWTLDTCYGDVVGGRRSLLILGSAKNITQLMVNHWIQEGFTANIDVLQAESKAPEYSSLYSQLESTFNERLEKLKKASEKHIKRATGSTLTENILSVSHIWKHRW